MADSDFLESILEKGRMIGEKAGEIASEAVDLGKQKFGEIKTEYDVEKTYARLGKLAYQAYKGEDKSLEIDALLTELDSLHSQREQNK